MTEQWFIVFQAQELELVLYASGDTASNVKIYVYGVHKYALQSQGGQAAPFIFASHIQQCPLAVQRGFRGQSCRFLSRLQLMTR